MSTLHEIFVSQEIEPIQQRLNQLRRDLRRFNKEIIHYALVADLPSLQAAVDTTYYLKSEILRDELGIIQLQRAFAANQFKKTIEH